MPSPALQPPGASALCALLAALQLLRVCVALARAAARRRLPCDCALLLGGRVPRTGGLACPASLTRPCRDEQRERLAAALLAGTATAEACVAGAPGSAARDAALHACANATSLPLIVSSAALRGVAPFVAAGIARSRVTADDSATDTVSNFSTALPLLRALRARHVLVLTSEPHAARAAAVAALTLGSCGLGATIVPLASPGAAESRLRLARDVARAALWALCGVHCGALGRLAHPERFTHLDARRRS